MTVFIDPAQRIGTISPKLHGQFIEYLGTCINEGIWVGEDSPIPNTKGYRNDVLDALKQLKPPVLRWPGGCYADMYHWRDGIGPREERPVTFNENFGTFEREDNQFGTDEFLQLCEMIGAEPWININMLSGTIQEMKDWMEYCNRAEDTTLSRLRAANGHSEPYNVKYWGIGNEVWSGGGTMTPQTYMDEYRRFASAMPKFTQSVFETSPMYAIASGPDSNKPRESVKWTEDVFTALSEYRQPPIHGYDMHFYNWNVSDPADTPTEFTREGWNRVISGCLELEDLIVEQAALVDSSIQRVPEPEGPLDSKLTHVDLVLGEWGNWHYSAFSAQPALKQQVTMRDAITTALTLDLLQRHCDVLTMACNAQTVNVLNSLILTEGEDMVITPNYDVFMMYQAHRGARALSIPRQDKETGVYTFASEKDGVITVDLVNASMDAATDVELLFASPVDVVSVRRLEADDPHSCNTPESPDAVRSYQVDAPAETGASHTLSLPAASVTVLTARVL
ncbi:alpha-L-arabinofuranosidase [Alloscardovia macacae]|uniref:non-reducing end alpha-L-arabinofuranosidase n=1 Tax=Alloscardovia macacae TaxID=1160091 RepID=A0A1Y2SWJ1_9BIFI|nr:alpha-L-arabinofuranosidase C-terminal domain-containing protein [Alloscardovia macacae]OTA26103.1 alpha-L-arabinofuranosidase [Alloscardovia macacae]OTA28596.1 alpha-L-arabinofuranosidase [Alloscardovia macacae]